MNTFRPANFMLLPTMACQASCRYCFAKKTRRIMSLDTAEAAVDFIGRIAPEKKDFRLTFHGGEPLLAGYGFYAWILPLLSERFGRRVHLSIQSNLWAMTDELAELFAYYQVSVGTSLDGPKDMCDGQRGTGYYDKTMTGIEILKRHGIPVGPICTFTGDSAHRAAEIYENSPQPYAVHGAVPVLGAQDRRGSVTPEEMKRILLDSYSAYKADSAHGRITTIDSMAHGCLDGRGCTCTFFDCLGAFAAIGPLGDVYSCQRFCGVEEYRFGNVSDGLTEAEILQSPGYARLHAAQEAMHSACGDCHHFSYCRGGCLYNKLAAGTEKDPYCPAYHAVFDTIGMDMALEMGNVLLGQDGNTPVLAMAGDRKHPYDLRRSRESMRLALQCGRTEEGFGECLRSRFPERDLNKLYLHLTFSCPLRCDHCYAEGGEAQCAELSPEQFYQVIRDACDSRFHSVVITGGEPLVYEGFDELCRLLAALDRKGTKLVLRTSLAFPISAERLQCICGLFDEIVVSVDGDEETHDKRRGTGRYKQTVDNLKAAAGLHSSEKFSLSATLSRLQAEGRPGQSLYELSERLGIEKVRIRPVLPLGRAEGVERDAWRRCAEEAAFDDAFRPRHSCGLGQNLYVKPDGSAYPCYAWCAPDKILGNLSQESLRTLLNRGELYEYCRHDVDSNEKCRSCEVRYLCGGICKAWVRDKENIDSGDFDCTDRKEYYIRLAEKTEED